MSSSRRFVLIEPSGARREIAADPLPFRIGRQPENELMLRDSRISRQQAQIVSSNGTLILEDAGSRHGTFVNQRQDRVWNRR